MFADTASAARIKDLSSIKGVRGNQLIGFGLVIGLAGTGDSATNVFFSIQSVFNMLKKMGITIPSGEVVGFLGPVPSVAFCVPWTLWCRFF